MRIELTAREAVAVENFVRMIDFKNYVKSDKSRKFDDENAMEVTNDDGSTTTTVNPEFVVEALSVISKLVMMLMPMFKGIYETFKLVGKDASDMMNRYFPYQKGEYSVTSKIDGEDVVSYKLDYDMSNVTSTIPGRLYSTDYSRIAAELKTVINRYDRDMNACKYCSPVAYASLKEGKKKLEDLLQEMLSNKCKTEA